jgi:hypothetical protein
MDGLASSEKNNVAFTTPRSTDLPNMVHGWFFKIHKTFRYTRFIYFPEKFGHLGLARRV